jgi:hypothetical protein
MDGTDVWNRRMEMAGAEVLKSDPHYDPQEGAGVEFRLTVVVLPIPRVRE